MAVRLTGSLYTCETHVLYVGPMIASARHAHHAGQVLWAPDGLVLHGEDGRQRHAAVHVVPPNRPHAHGAAARAAVLWVDRNDLSWDRALERLDVSSGLPSALGARLGESLSPEEARELAQALLAVVATAHGAHVHAPLHPAVRRMCKLLDCTASGPAMRITELAQQAGLSIRQLRHRFTQELGINPRSYLRWRRLRRAIASIEKGATLTEAAAEGGFADGAHLCRVFQAQFGMPPSQALSSVRFAGSLI